MFGRTADQVIGTSVTNLLPEEKLIISQKRVLANILKVKQSRKSPNKLLENAHDDGGTELTEFSRAEAKAVHANNDETLDLFVTCVDGKIIPTTCSLSYIGLFCVVFIRDIRDIKHYQSLIERKENKIICFADNFESVTILFADIVKFTNWSSTMDPATLVSILNGLVCSWDAVAKKMGIEKIKTIGDCYMAVCGCPVKRKDHAKVMVNFAHEILKVINKFNDLHGDSIQIRIGIHTGPVIAGVIGLSKTTYDVWGPNVSVAAKMESSGTAMQIHISQNTYEIVKGNFPFRPDNTVKLKSGNDMKTYLYKPVLEAGTLSSTVMSMKGPAISNAALKKATRSHFK
jgi:class 3 adenylate cyclase